MNFLRNLAIPYKIVCCLLLILVLIVGVTVSLLGESNLLFIFCIFIFVVSLLVVLLLDLFIERPLKKIAEGITKITEGDLQTKISLTSHDEIGKLGNLLNLMVAALQQTFATLTQKEKDATSQLQAKIEQIEHERQELEDKKKTLTKLVEDAQKLQIQVQKEKEGVELEVKVRTQDLRDEQSRI